MSLCTRRRIEDILLPNSLLCCLSTAVLHTILFHRAFGEVAPMVVDCKSLDVSYVGRRFLLLCPFVTLFYVYCSITIYARQLSCSWHVFTVSYYVVLWRPTHTSAQAKVCPNPRTTTALPSQCTQTPTYHMHVRTRIATHASAYRTYMHAHAWVHTNSRRHNQARVIADICVQILGVRTGPEADVC